MHDKPESQEICFVPDDDYLGFVRGRRPERDTSGHVVDEQGKTLGFPPKGLETFVPAVAKGTWKP